MFHLQGQSRGIEDLEPHLGLVLMLANPTTLEKPKMLRVLLWPCCSAVMSQNCTRDGPQMQSESGYLQHSQPSGMSRGEGAHGSESS